MNNIKNTVKFLCAIPLIYLIGYLRGKKKGDGLVRLANRILENNAEEVDKLNEKVMEINRAMMLIKQWEKERSDDIYGFND